MGEILSWYTLFYSREENMITLQLYLDSELYEVMVVMYEYGKVNNVIVRYLLFT